MRLTKLRNDILRTKKQLIEKAKLSGLYENFGDTEYRELKDKHIDIQAHYVEIVPAENLLLEFERWCYNLDQTQLSQY